jgi:arylsulfatase A-like enzyme
LTPDGQQGPAGPFDRWPVGWGFDYFYGFLGGDSGQWDPCLAENQKIIGTPAAYYDQTKPYYLPDDMADKTIEWLHALRAQDARKPFFVYFSTGCSHAPHHVAAAWAEKYRGRFDQGWDRLREEVFARQKALGVIPADAELTPRDEAFPAWDDVPDKLKAYYARQMEVYAGYSENADHNVGRVIDAIDELGALDNTLIIWIWGDNGASMEGTITGSFNEMTMQNGIPLTDEMQLQLVERYGGIDAWGGELMDPHYAAAWAWAGNTPFKWGKQVGSHLGGTRNPMVAHWPARINDRGGLRSHFTHVIDVGPTILEAAGIPAPSHVDGIEQQPMHGVTFGDSLTDGNAPERHTQQYFETMGNRAMYKDGWWLAVRTRRIPWVITPQALKPFAPGVWDPDADPVELYYLPDDFTQARDIAAEHPEKVRELKQLFWEEAEKYKVLPLLATLASFFGFTPPLPEVSKIEFRGDVQNVMSGMIPRIYNHSYTISADLVVPEGGAEGVIVAEADHLGGFSLFVQDGRLTHTYSMMGVFIYRQQADEPLPVGEVNVRLEFAADAPKPATGGEVTLLVNDEPVAKGRMDHTVPVRFSAYAGMDIGRDNGAVVDRGYEQRKPFPFNGTVKKVVFDVKPHLSAEDEQKLHEVAHHGHTANGLSA